MNWTFDDELNKDSGEIKEKARKILTDGTIKHSQWEAKIKGLSFPDLLIEAIALVELYNQHIDKL